MIYAHKKVRKSRKIKWRWKMNSTWSLLHYLADCSSTLRQWTAAVKDINTSCQCDRTKLPINIKKRKAAERLAIEDDKQKIAIKLTLKLDTKTADSGVRWRASGSRWSLIRHSARNGWQQTGNRKARITTNPTCAYAGNLGILKKTQLDVKSVGGGLKTNSHWLDFKSGFKPQEKWRQVMIKINIRYYQT